MFYSYVSLENSFLSYDYNTHVGQGLVPDCLDHKNFVQQTQKGHLLSYTVLTKSITDTGKR